MNKIGYMLGVSLVFGITFSAAALMGRNPATQPEWYITNNSNCNPSVELVYMDMTEYLTTDKNCFIGLR